ncbi:sce7726 family protein [Hydrogenimonas thermophila]|uniref:sce7726 family protein n=1 Tax=Hydrogenimonas thermophila TaxID=223786 RepID=UPI0029372631|nr:sce7726 family protein [Hydrogenimonas thermophila]WOE70670.1 sce7726 family protein [Hydrogenimonas thermophila]WOE73188.1 sce7726 family protein [Hydrogenimonas thermophila]
MRNQNNIDNIAMLATLFSPLIIKELAKFGYSKKFSRILDYFMQRKYELSIDERLANSYDYIYEKLQKEYPNEYIYKNAIAKNILLGIHSLNTSFMINELRAKNSKVDVVIVNGTLTAYEIKSKYDNLNRLQKQLQDYKTVFEKIYVITDKKYSQNLLHLQKDGIGILVLNQNGSISTFTKASSQMDNIKLSNLFDILRKDEYLDIIKKISKIDIDVPNSQVYRCAKEIFVTLDKEKVYKEATKVLKKRGNNIMLKEFITKVPNSLKARAIETKLTKKEKNNFLSLLEVETKEIIARGL